MQSFAGYRVLATLGRGASSTIYAVEDPKTRQVYALKRVVKRTPEDERFITQALREHEIAVQFNHPTLRRSYKTIRLRNWFRTSELLVLMEFVDGVTLEQHRPDNLRDLVTVFIACSDALTDMHKLGYVHADIKPNNIMVTSETQVKLIDFGQSCKTGTIKDRIQGTPDYIAPEQVSRNVITPRTDVFCLGATMYWCLTGKNVPTTLPRENEVRFQTEVDLKAPSEIRPEIPTSLDRLVLHCVRQDPSERPATMTEVHKRMEISLHQIDKNRSASESNWTTDPATEI